MLKWNPFDSLVAATTGSRILGLDILRAAAILLVLYGHGALLFPLSQRGMLFSFIFFDPVTLFFVLSGFLIGRILLKTVTSGPFTFQSLAVFWFRRWMRTLPAYLVTLILLVRVHHKFDVSFILRYVFFIQNFNQPHPMWFWEAWSLSVEEWFYFLVPLIVFLVIGLFKTNGPNTILIVCAVILLYGPLYRWYIFETISYAGRGEWDGLFRKQVLMRLDSIVYGVVGAYIFCFKKHLWSYNKKLYLCAGLLLIFLTWRYNLKHIDQEGFYSSVFSFSVESVAMLLLLPWFEGIKTAKGPLARAVTFISSISYSLYLLNMSFVAFYVCVRVPTWGLSGDYLLGYKVAVYLITTFTTAVFLYSWVEHPFMLLRDRITTKMKPIKKVVV